MAKLKPLAAGIFLSSALSVSIVACATAPTVPVLNASGSNPWSHVSQPTTDPAQSIGEYSAGCLRGAKEIPSIGTGYQVMRPSRRRFFGHPQLLQFIEDFGKSIHQKGWGDLLIGDMGQPRGGPTLSGHASHQTGLDVDIWFIQERRGKILSVKERENLSAPSMVVDEFESLNSSHWKPQKMELLKVAADFENVERIFVNPVIKRELCKNFKGENWLAKIRPWWFHEEHFHVRLHCTTGDSTCHAQDAVPSGDGCDSALDDWFTAESKAKEKDMREHPSKALMPTLPKLCEKVLDEKKD